MNIRYNFRFGPEASWLVFNTVVGTVLVEVMSTDFTTVTDWRGWAIGFTIGILGRTIPAALIAAATDGFQVPGQPKDAPDAP